VPVSPNGSNKAPTTKGSPLSSRGSKKVAGQKIVSQSSSKASIAYSERSAKRSFAAANNLIWIASEARACYHSKLTNIMAEAIETENPRISNLVKIINEVKNYHHWAAFDQLYPDPNGIAHLVGIVAHIQQLRHYADTEHAMFERVYHNINPWKQDDIAGLPKAVTRTFTAPTPTPTKSEELQIWRKSPWWRRAIFGELPSRIEGSEAHNLHIGTLNKHKQHDRKLVVPTTFVHPGLYSYLVMSKFSRYDNRQACVDHLEKLGRKYWLDEKKVQLDSLSPLDVNKHFATVQKAVDECTTTYFLQEESQNIGRKTRLNDLAFWKRRVHNDNPAWRPKSQLPRSH